MVGTLWQPLGGYQSQTLPRTENFLGALSHGLALLTVVSFLLVEATALHEDPFQARGEPLPP